VAEEGLTERSAGLRLALRGLSFDQLRLDPRLADLEPKFSWSGAAGVHRLESEDQG